MYSASVIGPVARILSCMNFSIAFCRWRSDSRNRVCAHTHTCELRVAVSLDNCRLLQQLLSVRDVLAVVHNACDVRASIRRKNMTTA
jgi:hypothetical protein